MTDQHDLLPCPFCGNAPRSMWNDCSVPGMEDCGYWGIDCCVAQVHEDSEEEARSIWNRRAATQSTKPVALSEQEIEALDLDAATFDLLSDLVGVDVHEVNLRDHPTAWSFVGEFVEKAARAIERAHGITQHEGVKS